MWGTSGRGGNSGPGEVGLEVDRKIVMSEEVMIAVLEVKVVLTLPGIRVAWYLVVGQVIGFLYGDSCFSTDKSLKWRERMKC